jgi:outer membrane protein insertion porin family
MLKRGEVYKRLLTALLSAFLVFIFTGCDTTKHLKENEYLLRKNSVKLKSPQPIERRGELSDNVERLTAQKPNKYAVLGMFPFKLWFYNSRYKKYQEDRTNFQLQSKTVEPPVIYDSTLIPRSLANMKGYMYNQGYFYAQINDTTVFKGKKAYVTYDIQTGINYLIKDTRYDIRDSLVRVTIESGANETLLKPGIPYSKSLVDEERRRITMLLQDKGFYKFSQDNISFLIDTFNKEAIQDIDDPFESAINTIALNKKDNKPTLDISIIVRNDEDPSAFKRFAVSRVTVYPDFIDVKDVRDSTMIQKRVDNTLYKYHNYYVSEKVLHRNIYLERGRIYSQSDYNETINKLNELGVFSSINIYIREDTSSPGENLLIVGISMNKGKKHDFSTNVEATNGTTYLLGSALSLNFRDKNIGRGANLLRMSVSGGIESLNDANISGSYLNRFYLRTTYYGFNTSIDFPKFLVPFKLRASSNRNLPRSVISFGSSLMDRLNYFKLVNTTAAFSYNWRETQTKSWEVSPAFINIIRLPYISDSFKIRLNENQFLRNSYRESFVEGESIAFIFSDREKKKGQNYSYARIGLKEAGSLLTLIQRVGRLADESFNLNYFQYVKFDADLQHFFTRPHAALAVRFYGGVGIPYGGSTTLPYIKQYYVGGAYSMRGWRIRSLGPGSSQDTTGSSYIDRTGDIKLELNTEYRYDIVRLFSGAINLKGALFADAGNIWLASKSTGFPGGEFNFNKLGQHIAVNAGTGIRMDIAGFFILRLDLAIPLKKPYVFTNSGWVFNEFDPLYSEWRKRNMIFNFAIGYPF